MTTPTKRPPRYLVASDFDQTLSFNDSGRVLADIVGIRDFEEKVHGLASAHLVQQGAELAYLLRHDPAFRSVRREHLVEAGKRVRLKNDVKLLANILGEEIDGNTFSVRRHLRRAARSGAVGARGHCACGKCARHGAEL